MAAAALYALMPAVTHAQIAQFGDPPPDPNPRSARMGVERLPDASGKEEVATLCSRCHNLERIANQRRTERQWEALVPFMLGRLERAPRAEQMRAATTYLTEHWSRPETTAEAALAESAARARRGDAVGRSTRFVGRLDDDDVVHDAQYGAR